MYRILLSCSTLVLFCAGLPARVPRIYNVLISTKKNLSPSQALPVYEPVLRTSLGYAFPPLLYNTPFTGISTVGNAPYLSNPGVVYPEIRNNPNVEQGTQIQNGEGNNQQTDFIGAAGVSRLQNNIKSPAFLQEENSKLFKPAEQTEDSAQEPIPVEHFIPYSPLLRNYAPYLPKELQETQNNQEAQPQYNNVNDPKQIIANLKKNPEIPDVPPPPLPVKTT